jgi:hypothetical protein
VVKCAVHQEQEAIAVCKTCGNALCTSCRISIAGIAYCQTCLDAGRFRPPTSVAEKPEEPLPVPLGPVTPISRRNILIGVLGLIFIAIFIHTQWMFPYGYYFPMGSFNPSMFVPRSIGAVFVALGIALSAFAWYEFRNFFNFRWAFYIALFTLITPWFGIIAEALIYSGGVFSIVPPYGYWEPGPYAPIFNNLVFLSSFLFGILMILWAIALLWVRKKARSQRLTTGASVIYIILAHMTIIIISLFAQSYLFYPYPAVLISFGPTFLVSAVIIEIGVIANAVFFYRLAASLKPY